MDAYGVDVLHAADGDGVVGAVTHDLELDLLIALDALLHQHLMDGGEAEGVGSHFQQFFFVVGKAAAGTAQCKGGAQHHGIADLLGCCLGLGDGIGDLGGDHRLADLLTQLLEQLTILSSLNAAAGGAQQFHAALLQHAFFLQLHHEVQTRLTANAGDDGIGALVAQDAGHILQRQRFHIHLVRNGGVGHNGGGVGVHQHHLVALLLQRQTRLRTCVVKLCGLSDDDGPRADDHDFLQVCSLCHSSFPPTI